jgi:hypothetical protein
MYEKDALADRIRKEYSMISGFNEDNKFKTNTAKVNLGSLSITEFIKDTNNLKVFNPINNKTNDTNLKVNKNRLNITDNLGIPLSPKLDSNLFEQNCKQLYNINRQSELKNIKDYVLNRKCTIKNFKNYDK